MTEIDRRATIYADKILSQQRLAMYRGGTPWTRIKQTIHTIPIYPQVYQQPWNTYQPYPVIYPYQQYWNSYLYILR
jgi:hypothetical protein